MPYITQDRRGDLDGAIEALKDRLLNAVYQDRLKAEGDLNYVFTSLLEILPEMTTNVPSAPWDYQRINKAIGILECCKLEFYRRLAAPYEDEAQQRNGDVSPYS